MPAVYAHRRFGEKVLAACQNDEARTAIETYQDLFNIGLQGPDILFYYDPLRQNPYKAAGDALHDAPAAPFFEAGAAHVNGRPEGQALLSYLLGFLCHFALDSECHSYIEYEIGRSGHRHVAIETALDGALMEKDGVDWRTANPAGYIVVSEVTARTIARVVPAGREQVRQCLTNMKRVNRLLMPGGPVRNALVEGALRLAGKWEVLGGLLITALDRPAYAASSDELGYLFDGAVPVALELIDGYFVGEYADRVAGHACRALLYEVHIAPKPGLVDGRTAARTGTWTSLPFLTAPARSTPIFGSARKRGRCTERIRMPSLRCCGWTASWPSSGCCAPPAGSTPTRERSSRWGFSVR